MEKYDFENDFSSFYARIKMYNEPFIIFPSDIFFQNFLNTFLRVSNYLNYGTKYQEATGFNMDSMKRFDNIKSSNGKFTLLNAIIKDIKKGDENLLKFAKDFKDINKLSRESIKDFKTQQNDFNESIKRIKQEINNTKKLLERGMDEKDTESSKNF